MTRPRSAGPHRDRLLTHNTGLCRLYLDTTSNKDNVQYKVIVRSQDIELVMGPSLGRLVRDKQINLNQINLNLDKQTNRRTDGHRQTGRQTHRRTLCVFPVQCIVRQFLQIVLEQEFIARDPLNRLQHVVLESQVPTHILLLCR